MIAFIDSEARYSEAVIFNGLVFLSGQVDEGKSVDAFLQTEAILRQIDATLSRCGSDKRHILEATIYLADMADYELMNRAWDNWTDEKRAPARACVQAALADAAYKVEIKLTAAQIGGV